MPSLVDPAGQLTAAQEVAGQVVQPDALNGRMACNRFIRVFWRCEEGGRWLPAGSKAPIMQRHGEREAGKCAKD